MEPSQIVIVAIGVLALIVILLIIVLVIYLIVTLLRAKSADSKALEQDAAPPQAKPKHIAPAATDAWSDGTTPAGGQPTLTAPSSPRAQQVSDGWTSAPTGSHPHVPRADDRTPAGGTETYQSNRPPARVAPALAPPQPTMPRKRGTVMMNTGFLNDQLHQPESANQSRATPVASTARMPATRPSSITPPGATANVAPPRKPLIPTPATTTPAAKPPASGRDALFATFRNIHQPTSERLAAYKNLITALDEDERVLLNVEAINSDQMELQLVALEELNASKSDALMDELIPLVESPSADIALGALKALSNVGGPIVEQTMLAAMESQHATVRNHAKTSLLDHATPNLQNQLRDMIQDDDDKTIKIAATHLAELGGHENAELLRTRATMMSSSSPIRPLVDQAAEAAAATQARVTGSHAPFSGAQEVFAQDDVPEFEMTLDPELFNPKS